MSFFPGLTSGHLAQGLNDNLSASHLSHRNSRFVCSNNLKLGHLTRFLGSFHPFWVVPFGTTVFMILRESSI